jgi:hypothetical protein
MCRLNYARFPVPIHAFSPAASVSEKPTFALTVSAEILRVCQYHQILQKAPNSIHNHNGQVVVSFEDHFREWVVVVPTWRAKFH